MLSYLLFVVSLVSQSGQSDNVEKDRNAELKDGGETGGLIVKMGPVMNVHVTVSDVRVLGPGELAGEELPTVAHKGSLFESFSKNRVYAVHYGR